MDNHGNWEVWTTTGTGSEGGGVQGESQESINETTVNNEAIINR